MNTNTNSDQPWNLKMDDYLLIIVLMTQPVYCPRPSPLPSDQQNLLNAGLLDLIDPPGLLCLTVQGHLHIASLPRSSVMTAIEHLLNVFPESLRKHMVTAKN